METLTNIYSVLSEVKVLTEVRFLAILHIVNIEDSKSKLRLKYCRDTQPRSQMLISPRLIILMRLNVRLTDRTD